MKTNSVYLLLGVSLIAKILLAAFTPVFGDEAYYYIWSLHPQLSYFDHPPMVSWFISLGHMIFPAGNALALRSVFILAGFLTSIIWVRILRERGFSESLISGFLILIFLNPLLGPGSVVATPDVPMVLFWSLSYYCFLQIDSTSRRRWYAALGVALGLGFCAKYHIVIFVLSGLIYLLFKKRWAKLRVSGVALTLFFGAALSLPVIIWNAQNEWASFLFQINHGFSSDPFEWQWPVNYVLTQILLLSPFVFYSILRAAKTGRPERIFALSQLLFFFSSSLKSVVEANWPISSHLHATAHFSETGSQKFFRYSLIYWIVIYILLALFFVLPASERVRKNLINSSQMNELIPLAEKYEPLFGPSYQVSSLLSWQTQRVIPKLNGLSRHDFYDSLPESTPTTATFYALKNDYSSWPQQYDRYKKTRLLVFDKTGLELYQLSYE